MRYNLAAQPVDSSLQVHYVVLIGDKLCNVQQGNELRYYSCNGRTSDSPSEHKYEEWVQYAIDYNSEDCGRHSLLWEPYHPNHTVESKVEMGNNVSAQNDYHILTGVTYCVVTSAKEVENWS